MLKKMTLLAMAVAALVAFAAPSTASAATWATNGVHWAGETTEEGDNVHLTGTLAFTKSGLKFSCDATANAVVWNVANEGFGHTTLTLFAKHGETVGCTVEVFNSGLGKYVVIPNCHLTPSSTGENWPITTSGSTAVIEEANFKNKFSGCGAIGIPNGFEAGDEGTVTGLVEGGCIKFSNAGDFNGGTLVDGFLCPTEGNKLELT